MMNFEAPEAELLERAQENQAYRKARQVVEESRIKPDIEAFRGIYTEEEISRDEAYVGEKEVEFKKNVPPEQKRLNQLATVFEAIVHEQAEQSDWLGPDAMTVMSSRFDDIANGTDTIVEFPEGKESASRLALAIDETFSSDISKKFLKIKKEIENGELAHIKYFISEITDFRGMLSNLPRVVIGADVKTVRELGELWLEDEKKALGSHQIQFQILEELLLQLNTFAAYAKKMEKPEIAAIYRKAHGIIAEIWKEKQKAMVDEGLRDSVFQAIKFELGIFK